MTSCEKCDSEGKGYTVSKVGFFKNLVCATPFAEGNNMVPIAASCSQILVKYRCSNGHSWEISN